MFDSILPFLSFQSTRPAGVTSSSAQTTCASQRRGAATETTTARMNQMRRTVVSLFIAFTISALDKLNQLKTSIEYTLELNDYWKFEIN